jgi:hypothetical protein
MHSELTVGQAIIYVWFALAVLVEIVSSFVLWLLLRRRGVRLSFGLTGVPGYLERIYKDWCRNQGRSSKRVLLLRAASLVDLIVAAIFAIPLLAAR